MGVGAVQARALEAQHALGADQKIDHPRAFQMPALHQDGARAHRQQVPAGLGHAGLVGDGKPGQRLGLGDVRGYHRGQGKQPPHQRLMGRIIEQLVTALGDHHRIDHQRQAGRLFLQHPGDRLDRLEFAQHSGLDGIGADVVEHQGDLLGNEIAGHVDHPEHALGVLGGQGGDGGRRIAAERRHRLDIGLNAGPAARIRAGDDQDPAAQFRAGTHRAAAA